jgi:putative transposase
LQKKGKKMKLLDFLTKFSDEQSFKEYYRDNYYFRKWKRDGLIEETHDMEKIRILISKKPTPSVSIVDSQSVMSCNPCEGDIGFDGGKKIKGRKRHIVVDILGKGMIIVIHAANIHDSIGAKEVMRALRDKYLSGIQKIFADGGYIGDLAEWVRIQLGWTLEITKEMKRIHSKYCPNNG